MLFKFTNFAETTLQRKVFDADTAFVVDTQFAGSFPVIGAEEAFPIVLQDGKQDPEIAYVTAVDGENWTVLRGQEDTVARVWAVGTLIIHTVTAASFGGTVAYLEGIKTLVSDTVEPLEVRLGTAEASIAVLEAVTVTDGTALVALVTTLQANVDDVAASVTVEQTARIAGDTAQATYSLTLRSDIDDASAEISSNFTTLTDQYEALATDVETLSTDFGSFSSSVSTSLTSLSDEDTALASRIDSVEAVNTTQAASITTETTARITAVSALASRTTTLEAQIANSTGSGLRSRIASEETTRASETGALATRSTTLEASSLYGSTFELPSMFEQDGKFFQYGFTLKPESTTELTSASPGISFTNGTTGAVETRGRAVRVAPPIGGDIYIGNRGWVKIVPGRSYRTRVTFSVVEHLEASPIVGAYVIGLDPAGGLVVGGYGDSLLSVFDTNVHTTEVTFDAATLLAGGATFARGGSIFRNNPSVYSCYKIEFQEVTDYIETKARITEEETTRITENLALATRSTTLEAQMAGTTSSGLKVAYTALVSAEETARVTAVSAEATARLTLQTAVDANTASITVESTTRTTETGALATRATTLEAQLAGTTSSGLRARIATEETSRADGDVALSDRMDVLEAGGGTDLTPVYAAITTEETARIDADDDLDGSISALASRTTTLEAQIGDTSGSGLRTRITNEETARTTETAALGLRATSLESTVAVKITSFVQGTAPTSVGRIEGDLWFDSSTGNKPYRWTSGAWTAVRDATIATAQSAAGAAQTTADSKIKTFYASSTPTASSVGDLWIDTGHNNQPFRWNGSAWVSIQDGFISTVNARVATEETTRASETGALASRVTDLETSGGYDASALYSAIHDEEVARIGADGALSTRTTTLETSITTKITVFRQTTAPGGSHTTGDLWFDTDDGNKPYSWSGSAWVSIQDAVGTDAAAAASTAQTTANGKNTVYRQGSAPTVGPAGDLWIDTAHGNLLKVSNGSSWVSSQDAAIGDAATAAAGAQSSANGKSTVYRQAYAPALSPAGDVWFDSGNGNLPYVSNGSAWIASQDAAIATAASAAGTAQTTANSKNQVFRQGTTPTATAVGDLWFDSSLDNKVYRWSGSAWVAVDDARIAAQAITLGLHATTLTSLEGALSGNWGVQFDINGRLVGAIDLTVGGGGSTKSSLDITVDKLRVWQPGPATTIPMFELDSGNVARIAGDRVVTQSVLDAAITNAVASVDTSTRTVSGTTDGASVSLTTTGKRVELLAAIHYPQRGQAGSSFTITFKVLRDSTVLFTITAYTAHVQFDSSGLFDGYWIGGGVISIPVYDTPSTGTYTYKVQSVANSQNHQIDYASIRAMEIKK